MAIQLEGKSERKLKIKTRL